MDTTNAPSLRTKLIFWLLLAFLSVAVAEVTVASASFAFVNPIETVFLTTFYGSHLLVLAWLVFRRGWPSLPALWFAGVLFGLYEFYITKVLWAPPWGDLISMAHVDVISFIVLAFFWHPFMAFILPLAIGEAVGTNRGWVRSRLPERITNLSGHRAAIGLGVAAVTHGLLTDSPVVALISTVSAFGAVAAVVWWWRRNDRHQTWNLRDLLPNDDQGHWIALLLAIQYLVFIPTWTPEKMPPFVGHLVVWLLYAGFALLLRSALQQSTYELPGHQRSGLRSRTLVKWSLALMGLAVVGSLGPAEIGLIPVWLIATIVGVRMLIVSVRQVLRQPGQTVSQ